MWLEIRSHNNKFFLCVVYRAESNTDNSFWDLLQEQINLVKQEHKPKIIITGDLNADPATRQGILLKQFTFVNDFSLLVDEPTRVTQDSSTILDQFITNIPLCVTDVSVLPPVSKNDHCTITMKCMFRVVAGAAYKRIMWNYKETNFDLYRYAIAQNNFDECFSSDCIDAVCQSWTDKVMEIALRTIKHKTVTVRTKDKPWYTSRLRTLKRKKDRLHNVAKNNKTSHSWDRYKEARNDYFLKVKLAQSEHENKRYEAISRNENINTKKWWQILKQVYQCNDIFESIPPLENGQDIITNNTEKANLFNNYFCQASVIDESNSAVPEAIRILQDDFDLTDIFITDQDVKDQIAQLDISKAYGPDGISPTLITQAGDKMITLLRKLFNLSLRMQKVPKLWKQANVIPIHKKDKKSDVSNYRPISLISVVSKIFEKVIFKYVYNHLHDNFIISSYQSGFLPGKSTTTQLLEVYHLFCRAVDDGKELRVVFLDISKAFDRVWHAGLIYKLHQSGISSNLLNWFRNYLSDRQQRVVVHGQSSEWSSIKAGVPQGSVLGPLLFLLYINDISNAVQHCHIRLFADDTCLFIEVDNREDAAAKINEDLDALYQWSLDWLVSFSEPKTKALTISNKKDFNKNPPIAMNNILIEEVQSFKYLGLTFTRNLRWNNHVDKVATNAQKRLNAMMPLKFKISRKSLEIMYKSFVMPVLEYGLIVWGGTYDTDILKLEKIQIDALRLITGATARSNIVALYEETAFVPLRERIDHLSLIMLFKIHHNIAPDYLARLLPNTNNEAIQYNLRNNKNIKLPFTRLESFKRSFFPIAVRLWNSLTVTTRDSPSLAHFKTILYKDIDVCNVLFYYGERWASVHHARIRMRCSKLNADLCYKLHVLDNPACSCGHPLEDCNHFFMWCANYNDLRVTLFASVSQVTPVLLKTLLHGSDTLNKDRNLIVFKSVQKFILDSNRFSQ